MHATDYRMQRDSNWQVYVHFHQFEGEPGWNGIGRGGRIRTGDPLRPRQVRYQAALRPDSTIIPHAQSALPLTETHTNSSSPQDFSALAPHSGRVGTEVKMTRTNAAVLLWAPRGAGVAMALFLSLFALDAVDGKSIVEAIPAFLVHLGPASLVLAIVALAWRFPLAGAAGFTLLAIGYAVMVHWRA